MSDFDQSLFWPAFVAAGMLSTATITSNGVTADYSVGFVQPGVMRLDGRTISSEYEIEYQHADIPTLAEDDAVVIDGVSYRVREAPFVALGAPDGYFRRALLTTVSP